MTANAHRWLLVAALTLAGVGCGGPDDTLRVSAAASLSDVFTELATAYEASTGVDVELSFAGSSTIVTQVLEGAPVDVVATANAETMGRLVAAGQTAGEADPFASNSLIVVTPLDDPGAVEGLDDLGRVLLAACAPQVPCGALFAELVQDAGLSIVADSQEPDVRSVRAKVLLGEVDAGVVYRTDADEELRTVEIDPERRFTTPYPIAVLERSARRRDAEAFVAFVASEDGQRILAEHGFSAP